MRATWCHPVLLGVLAISAVLVGSWVVSRPDSPGANAQGGAAVSASETLRPVVPPTAAVPNEPRVLSPGVVTSGQGSRERQQKLALQCVSILSETNAVARQTAFEEFIRSTTDFEGLVGIVQGFRELSKSGKKNPEEWNSLWQILSRRDPREAVALLDRFGDELDYRVVASKITKEWGAMDPKSALEWINGNARLDERAVEGTFSNLISGYARSDLKGATQYTVSNVKPEEKLFQGIAKSLATTAMNSGGVAELKAWYEILPNDEYRRAAFKAVADEIKVASKDEYATWLDHHAASAFRNDNVYREYVSSLAKSDPRDAMAYAVALPLSPNDGKPTGVGDAAKAWFHQDVAGLAAYHNSLAQGPVKSTIQWHVQRLMNSPVSLELKKQAKAQFDFGAKK